MIVPMKGRKGVRFTSAEEIRTRRTNLKSDLDAKERRWAEDKRRRQAATARWLRRRAAA